jgi:GT2 family glycosyltransferase
MTNSTYNDKSEKKFFAAFIVTYERDSILEGTIQTVLAQTFPPEKIWIIDNSESFRTQQLINKLNHPQVVYYRMGYNAGPAGGVAMGLKIVAEEGYDWIYWGDDDDPPKFKDSFEILLKIAQKSNNCGVVGAVGQYFNRKKGNIERVPDEILKGQGNLEVNTVAGGLSKIVNANMIREHGVLIDACLFFGFEELDFDLKVSRHGYKLIVDKTLYYRNRKDSNRLNLGKIVRTKISFDNLWRDYYSYRNLLFIYRYHQLYNALIILIAKRSIKSILCFRYGFTYGFKNFKYSFLAFIHFLLNKKGLTVKPQKKY